MMAQNVSGKFQFSSFFAHFFFFFFFHAHYWMLACGISCVPFFSLQRPQWRGGHVTTDSIARTSSPSSLDFLYLFFVFVPGGWRMTFRVCRNPPSKCAVRDSDNGTTDFCFPYSSSRCRCCCCWIVSFVFSFFFCVEKSSACDRGRFWRRENLIEIKRGKKKRNVFVSSQWGRNDRCRHGEHVFLPKKPFCFLYFAVYNNS